MKKAYKKQRTLILKILTHFKRETKYIQLNGGQSTKLQNQSFLKKYDNFPDYFIKKCRDNTNEAHNIPPELKIT